MNRPNRLMTLAIVVAVASCGAAGSEPGPKRHAVEIRGFGFAPASLSVAPGDTIVWVNNDAVPHTATSAVGGWDSGSIAAGGSWTLVVEEGQVGEYLCTFHPTMTAELTE